MKTRLFFLFLVLGIIIGIKTNHCTNPNDQVACTNKPVNIDIGSINGTPSKASILLSLQSVQTPLLETHMLLDPHISRSTESPEKHPVLNSSILSKWYIALQSPLQ